MNAKLARTALLTAVLAAAFTTRSYAETEANRATLTLDLTDGSRVVGRAGADTLAVRSAVGPLLIPLALVREGRFRDAGETLTLQFANGDKLTGSPDFGQFEVESLIGKLTLPVSAVTGFRVRPSAGRGPRVHWSFDESETAGPELALTPSVQKAAGVSGHGIRLTRPDSYGTCADPALNTLGWQAMTIAVWAKPMRYTTYGTVISRGTDQNGSGFVLNVNKTYAAGFHVYFAKDKLECVFSKIFSKDSPTFPPTDQWYHFAGVYDGDSLRFYVNGKLDNEVQLPAHRRGAPLWDDPAAITHVGTAAYLPFRTWSDQYFDGILDEIEIHDAALSDAQIEDIYNRGCTAPDR